MCGACGAHVMLSLRRDALRAAPFRWEWSPHMFDVHVLISTIVIVGALVRADSVLLLWCWLHVGGILPVHACAFRAFTRCAIRVVVCKPLVLCLCNAMRCDVA